MYTVTQEDLDALPKRNPEQRYTLSNGQYLPADSPDIPEALKTGPAYEKPVYVFPDARERP